MSQTPALPSYAELAEALTAAKSSFNPAQVHGLFCGLLCGSSDQMTKKLEKMLVGDKKNPRCSELLKELFETSYHQMSEFSFEFALLLPEDDIDINARTESLGLWCQGFLTGLEQSHVPIQNREEGDVTETINDLVEISQVNYGDIQSDDEDETAYFELVEYVRLGALLIYQELKTPTQDESDLESDDTIH